MLARQEFVALAKGWRELDCHGETYHYALRFGPTHLAAENETPALSALLLDYRFLEAKVEAGMLDELVGDYAARPQARELALVQWWDGYSCSAISRQLLLAGENLRAGGDGGLGVVFSRVGCDIVFGGNGKSRHELDLLFAGGPALMDIDHSEAKKGQGNICAGSRFRAGSQNSDGMFTRDLTPVA